MGTDGCTPLRAIPGRKCHCHFEDEQAKAQSGGTSWPRSTSKPVAQAPQPGAGTLETLADSPALQSPSQPGRRHKARADLLKDLSLPLLLQGQPLVILVPFASGAYLLLEEGEVCLLKHPRLGGAGGSAKALGQNKHFPSHSSPLWNLDPCSALLGVGGGGGTL